MPSAEGARPEEGRPRPGNAGAWARPDHLVDRFPFDERFDTCVAKMERAMAIDRTVGVTTLAGDCAVEAGRFADGARYLSLALEMGIKEKEVEAHAEQQLARAKAKVATVTVTLEPPAATLTVDGAPAERVGGAVFLSPGSHTFRAELPGHEPAEETRAFGAGERGEVALALDRIAALPPPGPEPEPRGEQSAGAGPWIAGTGLAIGVVAIVAGAALFSTAGEAGDEADALRAELRAQYGEAPCRVASDPRCATLADRVDDRDSRRTGAVPLLAAGSALAIAGAIGLIVVASENTSTDDSDGATIGLAPGVSSQGVTFTLFGRF